VHPLINGLSDHDAQTITFSNIFISAPRHAFSFTRKINNHLISKFAYLLSCEKWEDVFLESNVNTTFNNFLNTFLKIFYSSFPVDKLHHSHKQKPWLTTGIKISCENKRKLYFTYRNSNDPNFKEYYKKYCRTLTKVILLAKKLYYNKLLLKSNNNPKTTWNIVKTITNNKDTINNISLMNIKDKMFHNPLAIANEFNTYFTLGAENLLSKNFSGKTIINTKDAISYLHQNFRQSFPTMKLRHTTTYEIEKIIHSLKRKNSHGYDEISTRILKANAPYLYHP
jgi:hypothetical protein